jgi:hypothetical protein
MTSSSFSCVNTSDLDKLAKAASAYKRMSSVKVVTQAATQAGEHLKTAMQKTITGESTLRDYHDVADAISVGSGSSNVYVGLPDSHPLYSRALDMHKVYPVSDVVMDLTQQQGDTEAKFLDALAEAISK